MLIMAKAEQDPAVSLRVVHHLKYEATSRIQERVHDATDAISQVS